MEANHTTFSVVKGVGNYKPYLFILSDRLCMQGLIPTHHIPAASGLTFDEARALRDLLEIGDPYE